MTRDELRYYADQWESTRDQFAGDIGISRPTLQKWLAGSTPVPTTAAKLIRYMADELGIKPYNNGRAEENEATVTPGANTADAPF